jgi:hypothetical protein
LALHRFCRDDPNIAVNPGRVDDVLYAKGQAAHQNHRPLPDKATDDEEYTAMTQSLQTEVATNIRVDTSSQLPLNFT